MNYTDKRLKFGCNKKCGCLNFGVEAIKSGFRFSRVWNDNFHILPIKIAENSAWNKGATVPNAWSILSKIKKKNIVLAFKRDIARGL